MRAEVLVGAVLAAVVVLSTIAVAATSGGRPAAVTAGTGRSIEQPPAASPPASDAPATVPPARPTASASVDVQPAESGAATTSTAVPAVTTTPPAADGAAATATPPPQPEDDPSVVARPVPAPTPEQAPPPAPRPPWADSTRTTASGHVAVDVGCAGGTDAGALDTFLAGRVGPILGWDYQHIYPLGGDRHLWLFQDAFVDHSGGAVELGQAGFAHNVAMVQDGACFSVLHRGSIFAPQPFETGTGSATRTRWFWPMGGETHGGRLTVFWAEMVKDPVDPAPPHGLGWHPAATWIATYDAATLTRLDFRRAPDSGVVPIYGYAVASDATHTYLFGNTFEQNLTREGGYWTGPHSATRIYLARVPRGQFFSAPEYRTADGWAADAAAAVPILQRHWAEFPMQPRLIDGQWVAVAAVDGYWGDWYSLDVARRPWGPWTTVEARPLAPRGNDAKKNTYHAHLAPWRDGAGQLVVTVSNNARDMRRDAWPRPDRYRPMAFSSPWVVAPPLPTVAPSTSVAATTTAAPPAPSTTSTTSTSSTTTIPPSTSSTTTSSTSSTTSPPTSSTTTPPSTSAPSTTSPSTSAPSTSTTSTTSSSTTSTTTP